jgi:type I restriction enzyme S subunit
MSEWRTAKLGDVVGPAQRAEVPTPGTAYRQIGVKLWGEGAYERETIDGSQTKYAKLFRAEAGDIVVNKIWARNGSVAIVPRSLAGCFVSAEFPMFAPEPDRLESRWMHWLTKTPGFWAQCDEKSRGTSGKNRIKPEQFLSVEIPLPPLAEQRRVLARIEELASQIQEARTLRQQAAKEAEAIRVSHSRDQFDSPHRTDWGEMRIADACEAIIDYRGRTPPISERGIPHITSANIKEGRINWQTSKFVSEETYAVFMTRGIPRPQDVLFTMEAPLGEVGVVPDDRKFSLAQRVILLRPKPSMLTGDFLARALSSPGVRENILSKATATTVSGIASKRLKEVHVPVPPLPEQRRVVAELDAVQAEADALKRLQAETAAELGALLPSILDKAFKGEL